jgi:hypothetical protein
MAILAIVSGVANKPEPDGSFVMEITSPKGVSEAVLPAENVALFLRAMQESLIQRYASGEGNISLPEMEVTNINLAHREQTTALMVSTAEIATFVLILSDILLLTLRDKAAGALLHRSGTKTIN